MTKASFHTASISACLDTTAPGWAISASRTPNARGGSGTSDDPCHRPLPGSKRNGPK